jgi:hypothetical protein
MVFVICILALAILGVSYLALSVVKDALARIDLLHDAVLAIDDDAAERSESLHKLTRRYIGTKLIEDRLFPFLGVKEPEPSQEEITFNAIANSPEFEQSVIDDARKQCEASGIKWFGEADE